jgi:HAD superfamily hydrolase (TIGR01509 family)
MLDAVIFDCDGVLFDSWRANVAFYNAVLASLGRPPLDAEWESRAHVMASSQLFDALFGADPALHEQARDAARATDYEPFYGLMVPIEGLHQVLAALAEGHSLAVASNRGRTVAEVVRRFGIDRYLECAVGTLDVERPKPHPDMLLLCLERLGVAADRALFVGDAPSDLEAAAAAAIHFVAVGEHDWAPRAVAHLVDLPPYIRRLGVR